MNGIIRGVLIITCHCICILGVAQTKKVSNVFYRMIDDKIEIFYDLPKSSDTLEVKIFFRKKSLPKLKYQLKWVTGDVGVGKFYGKKLKATWKYKKEPNHLFTGSGFYYEIIAKKYKPPVKE